MSSIRVIKTKDRIELSHEQIQRVLKTFIENETGRVVDGEVHIRRGVYSKTQRGPICATR